MELLAGAAFAWCAAYVLLATYFAVLAGQTPREGRELALFAAACMFVGAYAFCCGEHYHSAEPVASAIWMRRALLVAPLAGAVMVHTALLYAEVDEKRRKWALPLVYSLAVVSLAINASDFAFDSTTRARVVAFGPISYVDHQFRARPLAHLGELFSFACMMTIVVLLVRSYLSGKREALIACIGGFFLSACLINDLLVFNHVHRGILLAEHGFSALAFGFSYTLLARHARVSEELVEKGAELRRRARQLRRSYEELREAQEELVRKEQLAVIGEIAAVVSHEVRNPLAIITNAVAGLRRGATSREDRDTLLAILEEEADRLNRLVGDLLRYARPLTVERQPLDLDGLVGRAVELARPHEQVKLELDDRVDRDASLPEVLGDPNLLRQVFDNLVQNACQAMPTGGTLSVRVGVSEENEARGVSVEISDTGEGMDTQVRSRARTPFFTTRPGGTGLGLAICDRIVTAHGGIMAIKSRSGEGTTVSVFLPSHPMEEKLSAAIRSSHPPSTASKRT